MKLLLALLLAAAPAPAPAPGPADAQAVIRAVIAREAEPNGDESDPYRACVKLAPGRSTFDGLRDMIRHPQPPPDPDTVVIGKPTTELGWSPSATGRERRRMVSSRLRPLLRSAVATIVARDRRPPLLDHLEAAWLPARFPLCGESAEQPFLEVLSPDFSGEFAFVYAAFYCPLCGHGGYYALRRGPSGWRIIAVREMWVS